MTQALITVDTELSALFHQRGIDVRDNFASSILGRCSGGEFGIGWQMDEMDRHGLTGVFFVDPMPALVYGEQIVADIVGPIIARGHEVQVHIHSEWLEWAPDSPVEGRQGRNIGDFSLEDQIILLRLARDLLQRAGAPAPVAIRAGNFGANDNTLRAAAQIGLRFDSSFNAAFAGTACAIALDSGQIDPVERHGLMELPVSGLHDRPGSFRAAQICAVSSREMHAALDHAARQRQACFMIVTHSFEMLSRDRQRPNRSVIGRFEAMCRAIATIEGVRSCGFVGLESGSGGMRSATRPTLLPPDRFRTMQRVLEQALGTWLYERRLLPA
ncbi:hypothetical protein GV829_12430 [Sphingomonas lacunae]|uniref:Polysaccharide deacetylase n=1 Tax=Sphingomonas lacunae TaxID=2698828 RepID=A0A6M4AXN5_9SPHN|nr:hypothetical protein [Sphingomonas lacunae]QJQ33142.1 hypothetical protein GV829_12430 [Sphingomonas lacunae]